MSYDKLADIDENRPDLPYDVEEQVNINIKYDGYIRRQMRQVEQFKKLENKKIPDNIDYNQIKSLRIEFYRSGIKNIRGISGRCICPACILEIMNM